ncbi:MAG TPA: hypothetical protein VF816_12045 [Rhodocyclaceae bacterium]
MTESPLDLLLHYWYAWAVGLLLAAIATGFLLRFVLPALRLGVELDAALDALAIVRETRPDGSTAALDDIARTAMTTPRLANLWQEYAQTLHAQADAAGGEARWRATTLAESFFTEEALVDSPLKTEFYKHLPGILTGLGIIGTFTGLIIGLIHFDVSLDPNQAQRQLRNLINSVGHAFFVSAVAISLAMLFTWVEKSLLTLRYRQVEQLRELIDGMFEVGADYEYLERLVTAAETSAEQAGRIKDALAGELRTIFGDISARQLDAAARQGDRLAAEIGRILGERLGQPMENVAQAVAAGSQRQEEVNRQLEQLAVHLHAGMLEAQQRSQDSLETSLARLGAGVSSAVAQLEERSRAAAQAQHEQSERLAHQAGEAVGGMASQVERLIARSIEASLGVQAAVDKLGTVTTEAIVGMNHGANTLAAAATDFALAGQGVTGTLKAAEGATETINFAANTLVSASAAAQRSLETHAQAQESFAGMVADLRGIVETARREASMSADLVDRLQAASAQLSAAERRAEDYLRGVNEVLVQAHQAFADGIERTLRESNRQFQLELSQAVGLLSGAIQDLGDLIESLPASRKAAP